MRLIEVCRAVAVLGWAAAWASVALGGHGLAHAGPDVNGDGTPDHVWVDQRGAQGRLAGVRLTALSGVDGAELWGVPTLGGSVAGDVTLIGDVTGDGVADVVVAEPAAEVGGGRRGRVTVHSGASGATHRTYTGDPGEIFGVYVRPLAAGGEGEGGGASAVAVGSVPVLSGGGGGGAVRVLDLVGGAELCRAGMVVAPHDAAGEPIVVRGDVNGDAAVDWDDLDAVMARLGDDACTLDNADLNANGVIDSHDAEAVMDGMDQPQAQGEGTAVMVSLPQVRAWRARYGVGAAQGPVACRVIEYRRPRRTAGEGLRLVGAQAPDTDGDLIPDWHEWLIGTDPASSDGDQDGLSDAGELLAGSDPDYGDSDGDWLFDGLEHRLGTSPIACDTDGDGADDRSELVSGARPRDPSDGGVPSAGAAAPVGDVTLVVGQETAPDLMAIAPWLGEPGMVVSVIEAVPGALFEGCQTDEHGTIGVCDTDGVTDVLGSIRSAGQRVLGGGPLSTDSGGFTAPGGGPGPAVVVHTFRIDLSVDSDNSNKDVPDCDEGPGPRQPSDNAYDDVIEDLERLPDGRLNPGKVILAAFGDDDGDYLLDFADGWGFYGDLSARGDTAGSGDAFVSVDLKITGPVLPDVDTVLITYPLSHPKPIRYVDAFPGYEPNPGALRLWVSPVSVDGGSKFSRDPRYVHEHEDGELVPSGAWMKLDALRGAGGGSAYALFAEGVAVSGVPGEARIEASLALGQRPNDGVVRVVEQGTDAVRLTVTHVEFQLASQVQPPAEYQWELAGGVIVIGLEVLDDLDKEVHGEWYRVPRHAVVQRAIVMDPREDLGPVAPPGGTPPIVVPPPQIAAGAPPVLRIGRAELPLSRELVKGRMVWVTQPFTAIGELPDPAKLSEPPSVPLVPVGAPEVTPCGVGFDIEYNPRRPRVPAACLPQVSVFDSVITQILGDVVLEAMGTGWRPSNPANDGEFGSHVHGGCTAEINRRYGTNVSRVVYADVYLHKDTRQILSIGQFNAPIVGVQSSDVVQIDVLHLKNARNLMVGQVLDTNNVTKYFDVTTGRDKAKQVLSGLLIDEHRRVKATMGQYPAIVPSTYRWGTNGFEQLVPVQRASIISERFGRQNTKLNRFLRHIPLFGEVVGVGMSLYVGPLLAEQFFETEITLSITRFYNTREQNERQLLMADVAHSIAVYLNDSTGGLIDDLMPFVVLYTSLGSPLP